MPRARDPNRDKAYELFKKHKGNIDLVEIANQLSIPSGTVRGWKNKDSWDNKLNGTFRKQLERNGTNEEVSWVAIEKEYVTDIRKNPCSLDDLSKLYNIPIQTIKDMSAKKEWSKKRSDYKLRTTQKAIEKSSDQDADRIVRLLKITDTAALKAEQSLDELETYLVHNKKKVKVIEYGDPNAFGKPTKEIISEDETIETMPGPIDRQGLSFITSSLKNIKDLYSITSGAEMQKHNIEYDNAKLELERKKIEPDNPSDGVKYTGIPSTMVAPAFAPVVFDIEGKLHQEYVFPGGRGSTKSSFISEEVIDLIMKNDGIHALVGRQVADTLRTSVYAQVMWAINALGLEDEFHCTVSPLEITRKSTNQKIYFRGADDPGKIKSIKVPFGYIGILWLEELDQFAGEEAVRKIEQSVIRGGELAYVFKSFNPPKTANNWANKYIKMPKANRLVTHSTYKDVPPQWLGKPFLDEAEFLRESNPVAYENEYMGIANGTGGNVFDNVKIEAITDEQIKQFDRLYNGLDWGWYPDPFHFGRMHYDAARMRLFIFMEYRCNKQSNRQTADKLIELGITANDLITCDSAEPKSVGDYRSYGLLARGADKGPGSVDYSMKWLQSLTEIIIDNSRCPETANEFLNYEYERDKEGNVISGYPDKNNHGIDMVRYGTNSIWKKRGQ